MSLSFQPWKLAALRALPPDAWWWTRRPKKDDDFLWYESQDIPAVITSNKNCFRRKYQVSRSLALVPGRGKPQVARATPRVIRLEHLQDITEEQAELELVFHWWLPAAAAEGGLGSWTGHRGRMAFSLLWDSIYAKRPALQWAANPQVWALGFRRADTVFEGEAK